MNTRRPRKPRPVLAELEPAEVAALVEVARAAVRVFVPRSCGTCSRATSCATLGRCLRGITAPSSMCQILAGACSAWTLDGMPGAITNERNHAPSAGAQAPGPAAGEGEGTP